MKVRKCAVGTNVQADATAFLFSSFTMLTPKMLTTYCASSLSNSERTIRSSRENVSRMGLSLCSINLSLQLAILVLKSFFIFFIPFETCH
jgi:hypothetical protein